MRRMRPFSATLTALVLLAALAGSAGAEEAPLTEQVQDLKRQVLQLNRELFLLEEELLFPSNTQLSVFLSVQTGTLFQLDSVQLKLGNELVASHLYTPRELDALAKGGVQRLWLGNLKSGNHELTAVFTGSGPHGRDYRRGATLKLDKGLAAQFLELKINDDGGKRQPEFVMREWQ
jgi:hypothetical protein